MPMMPRRPAWLLCLLLMWWLVCPIPLRSELLPTPPLPSARPELTRCFTELEWYVLGDQIEAEVARTAREAADAAVKAAVAPLLADLAGCRARAAGWEAEYRKTAVDLVAAQWWVFLGLAGTAGAAIVAALAILIR